MHGALSHIVSQCQSTVDAQMSRNGLATPLGREEKVASKQWSWTGRGALAAGGDFRGPQREEDERFL